MSNSSSTLILFIKASNTGMNTMNIPYQLFNAKPFPKKENTDPR
jgi:hypothetical protein